MIRQQNYGLQIIAMQGFLGCKIKLPKCYIQLNANYGDINYIYSFAPYYGHSHGTWSAKFLYGRN